MHQKRSPTTSGRRGSFPACRVSVGSCCSLAAEHFTHERTPRSRSASRQKLAEGGGIKTLRVLCGHALLLGQWQMPARPEKPLASRSGDASQEHSSVSPVCGFQDCFDFLNAAITGSSGEQFNLALYLQDFMASLDEDVKIYSQMDGRPLAFRQKVAHLCTSGFFVLVVSSWSLSLGRYTPQLKIPF